MTCPRRVSSSTELLVEVNGGTDQRQVGEGLREVPQRLARSADLLRVEAQVVGVREHLLERETSLVQAPGARERFDVPVRADRERPLLALEPVRRRLDVVAV